MREFMLLCGMDEAEMRLELPRFNKAFAIAGLNQADIKQAEARLNRYFDVKLMGMRKLIGIWVKEFVDAVLAKQEGKKIIYYSYPPVSGFAASMAIMSPDVYAIAPELLVEIVLGAFFDKMTPVLEEAEKEWLGPGLGHCPLLQARLGGLLKSIFPAPDLVVSMGVSCDQAPETDEIIAALYDAPLAYLDSRSDSQGDNWPLVEKWRIDYLVAEIRDTARMIEKVTGIEFNEDTINYGNKEAGKMREYQMKILALRKKEPQPLSIKDAQVLGELRTTCGLRAVKEGPNACSILLEELERRVAHGEGVLPKDAPRIAIVMPDYGDVAQTEVIENVGLNAILYLTEPTRAETEKAWAYGSVWEQIADLTLTGASRHSSQAYISKFMGLAKEYNVDGVILNSLSKCREYAIYPLKAKEVIERELGIPVIAPEHDPWDNREFTADIFRSRIEPFAEMLRERKKLKS